MSRAKTKADARAQPRRTFAAARLRVCANVFAHSRIHFDASRSLPADVKSVDREHSPRIGQPDPGDDGFGLAPRPPGASQSIIH